tara:strand:- start:1032 stop:1220 length:189 start_codon:yes stop_codon:yes gene_type:complete
MFLKEDEIKELTGYSTTSKQVDWLTSNRIMYFVNATNKVKVTWHAVNNPIKKVEEPDFSNVS